MANAFKNNGVATIGTSYVTVYAPSTTIPGTSGTVIGLSVANKHTDDVLIDAILSKPTGDFFIIKAAPITIGSTLLLFGGEQKMVVEPGDVVKVKSNVAASIDVIISVLEIF